MKYPKKVGLIASLFIAIITISFINSKDNSIQDLLKTQALWTTSYHAYQIADCKEEAKAAESLKQLSKNIRATINSEVKAIASSADFSSPLSTNNTSIAANFMMTATCPTIRVRELQGVPNFSETDQLVICGQPDTLAYLIFIEEAGNISGTQLTLDFKQGMQYAGFQLTHYDGTAISIVDPTPEKPRFLLDGITNGVYVAYIGVESTCAANIDAIDYTVDLNFNFIYEDTLGNFASCKQVAMPDRLYNTTIRKPVLNFRTANNINITSLGTQFCTTVNLSQDGIKANLAEFNFALTNLDLNGNLALNSLKANGLDLDYTYDNASKILQANPNGLHFNNNTSPAPDDGYFDTGEQIAIQLCFQVDECPDFSNQFLTYLASYGCHGDTCEVEQANVTLTVAPTTRPAPIVTSKLSRNPSVCGNSGIINLTLTSNQQDSAIGLFQDVIIGYETCEKPSLDISRVIIGTAPNTMAIAPENFSWEGNDLNIDFTSLENDPDGDGIGITDADGDGFFDDLPGGQILHIAIELDFSCTMPANPTSLNCANLDCSFSTFYVKAERDCGQSFTAYPTVDDFQITNGATFIGTNQAEISNGLFGIDFGATGTSGAKTKKVAFSYIYNRENVTPCSNEFASNKLQIIYNGTPAIVQDIVLKPNSIKLNGVAIADSKATWTNVDADTRMLVIDAGLNLLNETVTYEYELTVDTILCSPPIYMVGSHQVIETCNTGNCECQTVLACDEILFRSDPNASGCECVMRSRVLQMYRESTGFTDATMTEKVQPEEVPVEDRNRYLPGDTMVYEAGYRINTSDAFTDIYEWGMGFRFLDAGFISGVSTPNLELMMDAGKTELRAFEIKKAGTNQRITIDFSDIPACLDDNLTSTSIHGITMFFGKSPWEGAIRSRHQEYTGNSGYDYYDNARIYIQIRNQTKLQECRNIDYNSWADNGNCWDDFNAKYQFQVGDSLFLKAGIPMTKNPHRVLANQQNETPGIPLVYQDTWVTKLDEFDDNCLVGQSICRENVPFQTYCPSNVVASTTLQIDDCGGTASHTFTVDNTTPINWYTTEYRPYFQMQNMDLPILSPIMYCGNAKGTTKEGIEFPLTLQDTTNHTCVIVGGQSYCSVSGGNQGTITFNPQQDGFAGLGVGLGGYRDDFTVSYDLCMVCPIEIEGFDDYNIVYDYQYRGDPPNGFSYRCNFNANDPSTAEISACAALGNRFYYYNEWMLDTLMIKNDNTSADKIIDDQRLGFPALKQTLDRNVLSSIIPGQSEEINTITIDVDGTDLLKPTHQGVMATIKLANSVALKNVYDENDALLPFSYVTTDGITSTYRTSLVNLAPGDRVTIKLGTTLLFCPFAPLPPPTICVNVTSGCMDPAVQSAVVGHTEACNANEVCYAYVFGSAAIQADFLKPAGGSEYPLCSDIPVAVLIKNVKNVTVTDLTAAFDLPITGAKIVEGSFQASYPNGGDFTKPFYDIADPEINGNQLIYSEDQVFSPSIHTDGFPGIGALLDSNQMVIQFLMRTVCDSFVSASRLKFKSTAADPCSVNLLSTGTLESNQTIIENANPQDFAQILTTAEPAVAYCGATDTEFTLTGQNISQKPSGELMEICLTFPEELIYQDNSIAYAIPSGQSVGELTKMEVNGKTQICFSGVNNLPLGGQFTLKFKAEMQENAACGMVDIGVDIKELVKDQVCTTGGTCDVWVQTSVNDAASVELKAPIETVDIQLTKTCTNTEDPITVCYEAKLYNPGLAYTGDITIDLHDDLVSNKILEDYDPILASKLFDNQFIAAGDTIILSGCFELEELNACPVFVNIRYETDCVCDFDTEYFEVIAPDFIAELPQTTVLCVNEELGIATCGDYTYTIDSPTDAYMRTVGDSLYFGLNNPANEVAITVQGNTGECDYQEILFLKGLVPFTPYLKDTEACVNTPAYLQLVIPAEYEDEVMVSWSPTTNIDDPTILDPIFTAATAGTYTYTVQLTFGDGCIISETVSINVQPTADLTIVSEVGYCIANPPRKLTTDAGFDSYEWYILEGGFEIIQAVTTTNFWAGPSKGGIYLVKGYKNGVLCPSVSPSELVPSAKCPSLGNLVWEDSNNDGLSTNEQGIPNVEVSLYNLGIDAQKGGGDDLLIDTEITDQNGFYLFTNLDTGSYYVVLTNGIPNGMTSSNGTGINGTNLAKYEPAADPDDNLNNDDNGTQNQTLISADPITINLEDEPTNDGDNDNSTNLTLDFGLIRTASLGDFVWEDTNGDGIQNNGETGIQGIQVILSGTDGSGQLFKDTTYTDMLGAYNFDHLLPGDYALTFGDKDGFEFTQPNEGTGSQQDSLDSDAAENGLSQTVTLSIGEHNPTLDAGYYRPASIGDYVWLDTNADGIQNDGNNQGIENVEVILIGTDGLGNPVADTTFTNQTGFYEFTNLIPGDYAVKFVNPTDFNFSTPNLGMGIPQDSLDSDADPITGLTQTVTLISGENNPTLDAGLFEYASIGDYVWLDTNADGIQNDGNNQGIENVQVILMGTDGLGNPVADTTFTNQTGFYEFANLIPGDYAVKFVNPTDFNFSTPNLGMGISQDSLDSDADPITGLTQTVTLISGENNPTLDAGLFEYASIGDFAWLDINADGSQAAIDTGIAGIKVILTGTDNIGNQISKNTTTLADGHYLFDNLVPGAYSLAFETPNNLNITATNNNPNDSLDSDIDTQEITSIEILESGEHNPTYDAGYFAFASIGDYVWLDTNADGIQNDGNNQGIENVQVILIGTDGIGNPVADTTFTNETGFYEFTNLMPGDYAIKFVNPTDFNFSTPNLGMGVNQDSLDSDVDPMTGITQTVTLISGENNPTLDAGLFEYASIGNYVWEDMNGNGIQDEQNTGIQFVTVNLSGINAVGENITATTTTDENGFYLFDNLIPGSYQVSLISPEGYKITPSNQGTNDSLDSNIDENGVMMVEILTSGEHNLSYDAGLYQSASIGNYVWVDVNVDGLQNEGDSTQLANVPVFLMGVNGIGDSIKLSTMTDENGEYLFDTLAPGNYQVSFDIPAQYKATLQQIGNDTLVDSNPDSLGFSPHEILTSGEHNPSYDLGLIPDFDLALKIQLAAGEERDVTINDTVSFDIFIFNQGTADAFDIQLKNYIPKGLIFDSALNQTYDFQGNTWQADSSLVFNQLLVGESVSIPIHLVVDTTLMDSLVINHAEIVFASRVKGDGKYVEDIDSHADSNKDNDIIGGNNLLANEHEDEDDQDFSYVVFLMEVDPIGYIYCDKTGHILTGGTISVDVPPGGVAFIAQDGLSGMYQWWTNGVPGVYTMSYTHPSAFPLSTRCLPQSGFYDPTGRDGQAEDMDGIAGNMSISLGTAVTKDGSLVDTSCINNPYYLSFHLASGDPIINNNHIPVKCAFISSTVCEDQNNNGTQDAGEIGLPGIRVNLYKCTDTINPIATTLTGIDGVYEFDGLAAGDYMVQFVKPQTHRFALDAMPIGLLEQRGGFSTCTTLTFGDCDTSISMCLVPCPNVAITPGIETVFFGETLTATASGGNKYRWTPNIEIDCDTCETVKITPSTSRIYTVEIEDGYGCNNPATLAVNVLYNTARIYGPCECPANNLKTISGFSEQIAILSTIPNETWELVSNNGIKIGNSFAPIGTVLSPNGIENGFYQYILDIVHEDGIGYSGDFSNGQEVLNVSNICFSDNSCPVFIIPPTDSTSTPPPPTPVCTNIINVSNTPAIDTLADCNGCQFRSEGAEDATLYRDTSARNNVHTICPSNQWQTLKVTFSHFDLAAGDTLLVYDGPDTLSNLIGKYSGTGVSQIGGWLAASCQPSINASGCLTFNFKTNGDNRKGTGWIAETTCEEEATSLTLPNNLTAKIVCAETYQIFEINPATVTTNCSVNQDSQLVRIYNSHGALCKDTLIAFDKNFKDTFAIGQYLIEYKLKTDTIKSTQGVITVQAPSLVCNDVVSIPIGSACSVQITPDDLLENPCDTITDSLYYFITLIGVDKNGAEKIIATGGGKGGHYPILDKNQMNDCRNTIKVSLERRYYENANLTFCNNGVKTIACETNITIIDNAPPIFTTTASIDTFVKCDIRLTQTDLGITPPVAVDNCDSVVVTFAKASFLSPHQLCDTTRVEVEWQATDLCGNQATQTQLLVFVRPTIADIIKTSEVTLSCAADNGEDFVSEIPHIKIGQLKNGQLIPSDTVPLSTQDYVCGYILQKQDIFLPSTNCGKKVFRYWSVLDWCNPNNGPQPLDTTLIHFKDMTPPNFAEDTPTSQRISLAPFDCTYDVSQIAFPEANDNCSTPTVRLNAVNAITNEQLQTIPMADWATLKGDSFQLEWVAEDGCLQQNINDTLHQLLLLTDNTKPSAICTDHINISLPQSEAILHYRDIDEGSFDACGIQKYELSRDEITWDSIVVFTCEDIHKNNTLYLRVVDLAGNQNTCWMMVNVEDKIAPICSSLPNRIDTCDSVHLADLGQSTDANNNGQMDVEEWVDLTKEQITFYNTRYGNPNCSDNVACGALTIQQQYQLLEKTCGQIAIIRRYRAIDWQGNGNTSNWEEQTITIQYQPDWRITFPADWSGDCGGAIPASTLEITNGPCDALAYEVEENTFTVVEDACLKTIRKFTVINWCIYEVGTPAFMVPRIEDTHGIVTATQTIQSRHSLANQALSSVGRLEYHQVLKIQDTTQPIITVNPVNDCVTADNCQNEKVFSCSATDCNLQSTEALTYRWTLYKNRVLLETGNGPTFTRSVTVNEQFDIKWEAIDACGNVGTKTQFYYFVDCKKPVPYCLNGLAINLMEHGQVEVWAKDLDIVSSDNCTNLDRLQYRIWHTSYAETPPTHIASIHALPERITFDCSYLGNQTVRLYLIDQANNWDYCETYVNVQDNQQICGGSEIVTADTAFVNGQVLSWKGEQVEGVNISIATQQQTTGVTGQFEFQVAKNENYQLLPMKDDQPLNGVSTFDLVLISKHILGINRFNDPHQYIAADANKSGTVTAFDMVQLRRLILAIDQTLPNNTSWRFVNKAYVFPTDNPLQNAFPESIELTNLQTNQQADFSAIKIGDVNGNAATNSLILAESRTNLPVFEIDIVDQPIQAGQSYEVAFTSKQISHIQGYQFSLDFGQLTFEKLQPGIATLPNFGLHAIKKGWLTTSWNGAITKDSNELPSTAPLFTMHFTAQKDGLLSEQLKLQTTPTIPEAYDQDGALMDIQLNFIAPLATVFELYQNQPNPFDKQTLIGFHLPASSPVSLTILDERGQLLKVIKKTKMAGYQTINLADTDLPKGLIFYQLQTRFGTQTRKMLRIE